MIIDTFFKKTPQNTRQLAGGGKVSLIVFVIFDLFFPLKEYYIVVGLSRNIPVIIG